jgi:hypothetical protein
MLYCFVFVTVLLWSSLLSLLFDLSDPSFIWLFWRGLFDFHCLWSLWLCLSISSTTLVCFYGFILYFQGIMQVCFCCFLSLVYLYGKHVVAVSSFLPGCPCLSFVQLCLSWACWSQVIQLLFFLLCLSEPLLSLRILLFEYAAPICLTFKSTLQVAWLLLGVYSHDLSLSFYAYICFMVFLGP